MAHGVAVVGSANLDVVVSLPRLPRPGETVLGDRLEEVAGGKGLNQAIASARTTECAFVGCVGDDEAAALLLRQLASAHVETRYVERVAEPTGRAFIQVAADGENSIAVMALANQSLRPDVVTASLAVCQPAVVLAQLEIPLDAVGASATWAAGNGARFVLNPSPVRELPADLLTVCDPLVVNAGEAEALLGDDAPELRSGTDRSAYVQELAARLTGVARSVAVTDGSRGVHVATDAHGSTHVAGRTVRAVDTTGAGDEFAGALAAAFARGLDLVAAAQAANEAAAQVVQLSRRER